MSDIVDRLRKISGAIEAFADDNGAKVPAAYMREAADEIERLRAGGCARNQRLTQYCAEVPAAVLAEREACARIADDLHEVVSLDTYAVDQPISSTGERFACREIAAAIRARTKETTWTAKRSKRF